VLTRRAIRFLLRALLALALLSTAPKAAQAGAREVAVLLLAPRPVSQPDRGASRAIDTTGVPAAPSHAGESPRPAVERSSLAARGCHPSAALYLAHCALLL
jgi:hypothetical protein